MPSTVSDALDARESLPAALVSCMIWLLPEPGCLGLAARVPGESIGAEMQEEEKRGKAGSGVGNWRQGGNSAAALFHPPQLSSVFGKRLIFSPQLLHCLKRSQLKIHLA